MRITARPLTRRNSALAVSALFVVANSVSAQSLLDRINSAAKKVSAASAEIVLRSATSVDVEAMGLNTVQIGAASFGVASIDVKDTMALRVHAYLYNPTEGEVRVPMLSEGTFVLVDTKGRRITSFAPPKIKGLAAGATEITIAPLERVEITLLYGLMRPDADVGALKVGTLGIIHGLPLKAPPKDPAAVPPPDLLTPSPYYRSQ